VALWGGSAGGHLTALTALTCKQHRARSGRRWRCLRAGRGDLVRRL
jgi:hypothetical protein